MSLHRANKKRIRPLYIGALVGFGYITLNVPLLIAKMVWLDPHSLQRSHVQIAKSRIVVFIAQRSEVFVAATGKNDW